MFRLNRWMGFSVSFSRSRPFSSPFGRPNAIRTPRVLVHPRIHARIYMRDIGDRTRDNRRADRRVAHSLARSLARLSGVLVRPEGVTSGVARQWQGRKGGRTTERERGRGKEGGESREREREREDRETAVERKKRPESGVAQSESSGERTAGREMGWRERVDGRGRGLEAAG